MDLRLLIVLLRRWFLLLLMGAVIGGAIGFYYSISQPSLYRSSTKIMVMKPSERLTSDLMNISDAELAETFRSLLIVKPVLEATSAKAGVPVSEHQIWSELIDDTQLLEVTVHDRAPDRAALIANTLVEALIEHNESLQSNRFTASEESLQAQIAQVEEQMAALREEQGQRTELSAEEIAAKKELLETNILQLNEQIGRLELEVGELTVGTSQDELTPVQARLLKERNAELSLLELRLNAASRQYELLLADGAPESQLRAQRDNVLEIVQEISDLEDSIAGLTVIDEAPEEAEERQATLREKRAELAFLNLNLDLAAESYQNLVYNGDQLSEEARDDSQASANMALYQQIYSSLLSNYEAVRLARTQSTPSIVQVELATPGEAVRPNAISNAMLGAVIGLITMASIAFLVEYLDDTLKTPEDIDRVLALPVVGSITEASELSIDVDNGGAQTGPYVINYPRAPLGEAFRSLRTNLEFADVDDSLKTILVTSAGSGDGKTTIAANLAAAFSQQQKRVLLLDCDLRKPRIHKVFNVTNDVGMSNVFLGRSELHEAIHLFGTNLAVITSGKLPSNPAELLGSDSMTRFLEKVNEISDIVVIDSPPSVVTDAAILSTKVDGVIIVIRPGKTHADDALHQMEQMRRAGARIVGVVLNRIPARRSRYYSRYGYRYQSYGYGYGLEHSADGRTAKSQRVGSQSEQDRAIQPDREDSSAGQQTA